jgi:hypothetical protein
MSKKRKSQKSNLRKYTRKKSKKNRIMKGGMEKEQLDCYITDMLDDSNYISNTLNITIDTLNLNQSNPIIILQDFEKIFISKHLIPTLLKNDIFIKFLLSIKETQVILIIFFFSILIYNSYLESTYNSREIPGKLRSKKNALPHHVFKKLPKKTQKRLVAETKEIPIPECEWDSD